MQIQANYLPLTLHLDCPSCEFCQLHFFVALVWHKITGRPNRWGVLRGPRACTRRLPWGRLAWTQPECFNHRPVILTGTNSDPNRLEAALFTSRSHNACQLSVALFVQACCENEGLESTKHELIKTHSFMACFVVEKAQSLSPKQLQRINNVQPPCVRHTHNLL